MHYVPGFAVLIYFPPQALRSSLVSSQQRTGLFMIAQPSELKLAYVSTAYKSSEDQVSRPASVLGW